MHHGSDSGKVLHHDCMSSQERQAHLKKNKGHPKQNEGHSKENEVIDHICSNSANVHQSQSQVQTTRFLKIFWSASSCQMISEGEEPRCARYI